MKYYKVCFLDTWDNTYQEAYLFASSSLDAEIIFTQEEDDFVKILDVMEVEEC